MAMASCQCGFSAGLTGYKPGLSCNWSACKDLILCVECVCGAARFVGADE